MKKCNSCKKDRPLEDFQLKKNGTPRALCYRHYCEHDRHKPMCRECGNGKRFCVHGKQKQSCKECKGSLYCEHGKQKHICEVCTPYAKLTNCVRHRAHEVLTKVAPHGYGAVNYLGCTIEEFASHIESQFTPEMTWENRGTYWEIDHIVPLMGRVEGQRPTLEQVVERLHWTNTQPMTKEENRKKGGRMPDEEDQSAQ